MGEYPKNYRVFVAEGLGTLRAEMIDGRAWFYAVDICKILGLPKMCRLVSTGKITAGEYMLATRLAKNGRRKVYLITIPGVKELINTNICKDEDKLKTFFEWFCSKVTLELCGHMIDISGETIRMVGEPEKEEKATATIPDQMKEVKTMRAAENVPTVGEQVIENGNFRIFGNAEFGNIRTELINGEPWFVGSDVATALGYANARKALADHVDEQDKGVTKCYTLGGNQNMTIINESGLYALIFGSKLESAKRFKRWVTSEVLPAIRQTGSYQKHNQATEPLTTFEQIRLLATGTTELAQQVSSLKTEVTELKTDMPLYGCEIDEVQQHVRRKGVQCLGGKDSEAYHDASMRSLVYQDIYSQLKREYGCVSSYKSIKRKYIADVHDFIDCYQLPTALSEQVEAANAQQRLF